MNKTYIIDYKEEGTIKTTRIHANSLTRAITIFYIRYNAKIIGIYREI